MTERVSIEEYEDLYDDYPYDEYEVSEVGRRMVVGTWGTTTFPEHVNPDEVPF